MSEQENVQADTRGTKRRRSQQTTQSIARTPAPQYPAHDDREGWKAYWKQQGHLWRTEPEIDGERRDYLTARLHMTPSIEEGRYPFKDIPLSRADTEWLLATHENGQGPLDWSDEENRHERKGLDLRGATLRQVNLDGLPLTRVHAGLDQDERAGTTLAQCDLAAIHLEGASLIKAHLEEADFYRAHLENARFFRAHLSGAFLRGAYLQGADFFRAHLEGASLREAHLEGTGLRLAHLDEAELEDAHLSDEKRVGPLLADINWSNVNLTPVKWSQVKMVGDEYRARQPKTEQGLPKSRAKQLGQFLKALRTNRQLAVALQSQGLTEDADHFAYRAQLVQRIVWRYQHRWLKYTFSWFLFLLAGYGYRPLRTVIIYLLVIGGFSIGYYETTHVLHAQPYPLAWYEALILSVSSFHGRGFFQPVHSLADPLVILAAIEAIVGLLIEISFIATFTQRFFGK